MKRPRTLKPGVSPSTKVDHSHGYADDDLSRKTYQEQRDEAVKFLQEQGHLRATDDAKDIEAEGLIRAAAELRREPNNFFWVFYLAMRGGRPSY